MSERYDVSVVIGFKDWGVERLLLSVESLLNSFGTLRGEVIVSDYGSSEDNGLAEKLKALGARYVYTSTNGVWSRSRALNAGFAVSEGSVLISTDADMLFTPSSMQVVGNMVLTDHNCAVVLQCRDLPPRFDSGGIQSEGLQWSTFESVSTLRPRWGMGGMMAVHRDQYLDLRGFDERMEIYGGEDMDFAYRIQRNGCRLIWVEDPRVRMYHMWHSATRSVVDETEEGRAAVARNRAITLNDKSFIRNTTGWAHKPHDARPLASVVISTRNRADYIGDSINSVLMQTAAQDVEIIIVDDGSEDETEKVVNAFQDPRIRYYRQSQAGIAAARNFAAGVSLSKYTVIHDDDDIMTPERIEQHFSALEGGKCGTYGGWIDFQNEDGSVVSVNPGKEFSLEALLYTGKVLAHATLMLPTSLIRTVGYDELLRSGSDYNLAVRLGRSGVALKHTGHIHLIRRLHKNQVTSLDSTVQKASARLTSSLALASIPAEKQKSSRTIFKQTPDFVVPAAKNAQSFIRPYLPDHLVHRRIEFTSVLSQETIKQLRSELESSLLVVTEHKKDELVINISCFDATLNDLRIIKTMNIDHKIIASSKKIEFSPIEDIVRSIANEKMKNRSSSACVISTSDTFSNKSIHPDFTIQLPGEKLFAWIRHAIGSDNLHKIVTAKNDFNKQYVFVDNKNTTNWNELEGVIN